MHHAAPLITSYNPNAQNLNATLLGPVAVLLKPDTFVPVFPNPEFGPLPLGVAG